MAESDDLKVLAIDPLDCFEDFTVPIGDWLSRDTFDCDAYDKIAAYTRAFAAVSRHPLWDGRIRCLPRVAYNAIDDCGYFIFKIDNNGTTFLVGETLPEIDGHLGFVVGGKPNQNATGGGNGISL